MRAVLLALGLLVAAVPTAAADDPREYVLLCLPSGCTTTPLPATGAPLPGWAASPCAAPYVVHADGPLVVAEVCAADGNGDGAPETLSPRALAFVPVVYIIVFLVVQHDTEVTDADGDGVPDTVTGTPASVYAGYIYPCGFPAICAVVFCIACTEAALRLEDADGNGAPDAVAAALALNGQALLDQRVAVPG